MGRKRANLASAVAAAAAMWALGGTVTAATLTWDANGTATGTGGTGDWNTVDLSWNNGTAAWTDGNDAIFGGSSGTVTLRQDVSVTALTMSPSTAEAITLNLNGFSITNAGTVSGHGANLITNTNTLTASTIQGSSFNSVTLGGNLNVVKIGATTWSTTVAQSYTGKLTIQAGGVIVNQDSCLGAAGASVRLESTSTLTLNSVDTTTADGDPIASETYAHHIELAPGFSGSVIVGSNIITLAGNLTGSGALKRTGDGILILSGNNSGFSGSVSFAAAAGTIIAASNNAFGTNTGTLTLGAGGSTGVTVGFQGNVSVAAKPLQIDQAIGDDGKGQIHNFGGNNTFAGAITMNIVSGFGAEADSSLKLTGKITGTSSRTFVKRDAGTIELAAANEYRGTTIVRNGTLAIGTDAPLGDGGTTAGTNYGALGNKLWSDSTGVVLIGDGANTAATDNLALVITGPYEVERPLKLTNDNSLGTTKVGGTNTSGTAAFTGAMTLLRDVVLTSAPGGQVDFRPDTSTPFSVNSTHLGTGIISGAFNVKIDGGGTVRLASANTFGGAGKSVTVTGGTTLMVAGNGNLGSTSNGLVLDNGTLKFEGAFDPSTARTLTVGAGGAGFDTNGNNITFATPIGATTGGISKKGLGTLTLSGTNAYSGVTVIAGGTLALAAEASIPNTPSLNVASNATLDVTAASGGLTLADGQTLTGSGTVAGGNVSVANGSTVAPGSSAGTLTVGTNASPKDVELKSGGTYRWEISDATGAAGVGYDLLNVKGAVSVTATAEAPFQIRIVSLAVANLAPGMSFVIAHAGSAMTGFDPAKFQLFTDEIALAGGAWSVRQSQDLRDSELFYAAAVPEPAGFMVFATGAAGGAAVRRRRYGRGGR
jgi:autotransporter-associated beta strand protein